MERFGPNVRVRVALAALELERLLAAAVHGFSTARLTKLFQLPAGECVLEVDCIRDWLLRSTTWIVERDGLCAVCGLVSTAPWTQTGLEHGDENLLEIGLLCSAESAAGRLLLAHALREADLQCAAGVVLELLGGHYNKKAHALYAEFGFEHERRLCDDTGEPVRNEHGTLLFYLTLRRPPPPPDAAEPGENFFTPMRAARWLALKNRPEHAC